MPWVLAAAAVGVGGTLLASNNAANAAQSAADAQSQATQASIAEQQREFDLIQGETAPQRQIGNAAMGALGSYFGLPGYSGGQATNPAGSTGGSGGPSGYYGYPVTMTGTPAPASAALSPAPMTQMAVRPPGGGVVTSKQSYVDPNAHVVTSGPEPVAPVSTNPTASAGSAGGQTPDWNAFLHDPKNADVLAWAQSGHGDPNVPIDQQSMQQRAAYWYYNAQRLGDPRGSQPPPMVQTTPQASGSGPPPPPGYNDPTAPNGYGVGPRPTEGPQPAQYQAAARPMTSPLDVSTTAYQKSPGFDFQMQQAQRALDANSSATGGIQSGARLKAAAQYATGLANQDYTNWRDYTTNEYNIDRARNDNIYNYDRAFNYGASQDALAQYNTNRAFDNTIYESDRAYGANRSDTRSNQLMQLAGLGSGATGTSASAAQNFANAYGNLALAGANAKGSAAINAANAWSGGINNLLTTGAYLGGQYLGANPGIMTGGGAPSVAALQGLY